MMEGEPQSQPEIDPRIDRLYWLIARSYEITTEMDRLSKEQEKISIERRQLAEAGVVIPEGYIPEELPPDWEVDRF